MEVVEPEVMVSELDGMFIASSVEFINGRAICANIYPMVTTPGYRLTCAVAHNMELVADWSHEYETIWTAISDYKEWFVDYVRMSEREDEEVNKLEESITLWLTRDEAEVLSSVLRSVPFYDYAHHGAGAEEMIDSVLQSLNAEISKEGES